MFVFMLKGLVRRRFAGLLLALLAGVGACGMLLLSGLARAQEDALERTYTETNIRCVVSDLRGMQTDGLSIGQLYVDLCTKGGRHDFYLWVKRVCIKRTVSCVAQDSGEEFSLCGVTYPEAAPALLAENGALIQYMEGFAEDLFQSDQPLCVVPRALWLALPAREEDDQHLSLLLGEQAVSLRVAGVYESDLADAVYCPYYFLSPLLPQGAGAAESLSFYVKDTRTLDAFGQEALKYFSEPLLTADNKPMYFALAIQDELFRETIAEIKDNLSMLRLLLPALYALSAGVGFLASFLFMRGRTREFAVMRLLGVSRPRVTGLVFLEQLVLGALGCLAGAATGVGMQGAGGFSRLFSAALFVLCYLAGALISVGWMTNVSVMALLKADE